MARPQASDQALEIRPSRLFSGGNPIAAPAHAKEDPQAALAPGWWLRLCASLDP